MNQKISIGVVAKMLGINIQTLRRWDNNNFLHSNRSGILSYRYYTEDQIEDFLSNNYKYLEKTSREWAFNEKPPRILSRFHCPDKSIFKARLSKLELLLSRDKCLGIDYKFSLVTSIIGEIGNNSFDHNIGSWTDTIGIFFGYNLIEKKIILADRGQGLLTTLKRVKKKLSTHKAAVKVAFTEYISGRYPESRGNGLKYVRKVIEGTDNAKLKSLKLYFQSGNAQISIKHNSDILDIKKIKSFNKGCFALISY